MNKKALEKICLGKQSTIQDAILCLNQSHLGLVIVTDEKFRLVGTVTDTDIRQGLVVDANLNRPLIDICCCKPVSIAARTPVEEIRQVLQRTRLRAFPVIDPDKTVVDCILYDEIMSKLIKDPTILIMAGGLGKRMGPLTDTTPKPMLEFDNKPMLQHVIEKAAKDGFTRVFISLHYLAQQITDYFGDGSALGVSIEYLIEERALDTAGSIGLLPDLDEPVVVTNADVMTTVSYAKMLDFHILNSADVTLATYKHKIQNPFGVIESDGLLFIDMKEKPVWTTNVNAGIYVFNPTTSNYIDAGEKISMPKFIKKIQADNRNVIVFPLYEDWMDLGTREQLDIINNRVRSKLSPKS